jgi:hypothetical protein
LGCGDGRLNFAAVSFPHFAESSLGVDVDENVLERAKGRRDKRFVPTWNNDLDGRDDEKTARGEMDRLEFVQGDLVEAIRRQKEMHRKKLQLQPNDNDASIEDTTDSHQDLCTEIDKLNDKISTCTVITMYFVHNALDQLKPYLESLFGGNENVRIITIGYEMRGWEPDWAERVLDLTVFRYDMKNISRDPIEWSLDGENTNNSTINPPTQIDMNDEKINNFAQFLQQQKHQQEMELLNSNLRIHHDQELDDFASFRAKRKAIEDSTNGERPEDWEADWDFDEEEDGEAIMRREEKSRMEMKMAGRKSLMAGLDLGGDGGGGKVEKSTRPVWKRPE